MLQNIHVLALAEHLIAKSHDLYLILGLKQHFKFDRDLTVYQLQRIPDEDVYRKLDTLWCGFVQYAFNPDDADAGTLALAGALLLEKAYSLCAVPGARPLGGA
jgi:hypothetical protein